MNGKTLLYALVLAPIVALFTVSDGLANANYEQSGYSETDSVEWKSKKYGYKMTIQRNGRWYFDSSKKVWIFDHQLDATMFRSDGKRKSYRDRRIFTTAQVQDPNGRFGFNRTLSLGFSKNCTKIDYSAIYDWGKSRMWRVDQKKPNYTKPRSCKSP